MRYDELWRTLRYFGILATIVLLALIAHMTPAKASPPFNGITVYVEDHTNASWTTALNSSIWLVDRYTSSRMRRGNCPRKPDSQCIIIRLAHIPNAPGQRVVGWTQRDGAMRYLTIETSITGWYTRRAILDHELGHAFYLNHNPQCTSRMYPSIYCHWKLLPRTFTPAEQRTLARY